MNLYLNGAFSRDFIEDYLIQLLYMKIRHILESKNTSRLDEFLYEKYGLNVATIIEQIKFSINKYNDTWEISVNNNIVEEKSQEKLIALVKLIEYGNIYIKGLQIINEAFRYVNVHIKEIYKLYQMRGG